MVLDHVTQCQLGLEQHAACRCGQGRVGEGRSWIRQQGGREGRAAQDGGKGKEEKVTEAKRVKVSFIVTETFKYIKSHVPNEVVAHVGKTGQTVGNTRAVVRPKGASAVAIDNSDTWSRQASFEAHGTGSVRPEERALELHRGDPSPPRTFINA